MTEQMRYRILTISIAILVSAGISAAMVFYKTPAHRAIRSDGKTAEIATAIAMPPSRRECVIFIGSLQAQSAVFFLQNLYADLHGNARPNPAEPDSYDLQARNDYISAKAGGAPQIAGHAPSGTDMDFYMAGIRVMTDPWNASMAEFRDSIMLAEGRDMNEAQLFLHEMDVCKNLSRARLIARGREYILKIGVETPPAR